MLNHTILKVPESELINKKGTKVQLSKLKEDTKKKNLPQMELYPKAWEDVRTTIYEMGPTDCVLDFLS